ncbi:MAG: Na/Pi cotransporter family protein [Clostridia bacterium]|nr:Na/Pi cotransporter family protein [Clostridia bacterium]
MNIVLSLLCGLALFLYGMDVMGESLKKSAGTRLKQILEKMTSNPFKGFLLGLGVTAIIQSSSATTVMVVGFVNSGTMTLLQSVGVIMGANVGTAVTAWLTAMSGIGSDGVNEALGIIEWLKPDSWMPILAVIGICLVMFSKRGKKKDIGAILLGFSILMVGMSMMSDSVKDIPEESLKSILTMFENPILGVLAGCLLTCIVQSSSASIGILQSLTVTGAVSYGMAIPLIMGQNIGTCITAILSSLGASRNGKRAACIHLFFNVIGVVVLLSVFSIFNAIFKFPFVAGAIDMWGISLVHTVFKLMTVALIFPFHKLLVTLTNLVIKDKKDEREKTNLLDERLFETPGVAVGAATSVTVAMAKISADALKKSLEVFNSYDVKLADEVRDLESKADTYEDLLGSYLVKLSSYDMNEQDSNQITKLLHIIGDFERISDHAVNIVESAEEMKDKKLDFSSEAKHQISVMVKAIGDIVEMTYSAFANNDVKLAEQIEPLEEVVDRLRDEIKRGHVIRLQKSECDIEHGFVLSDLLNDFERVSDHCSNVGSCVVEISKYDDLSMHKYTDNVKANRDVFEETVNEYMKKYSF